MKYSPGPCSQNAKILSLSAALAEALRATRHFLMPVKVSIIIPVYNGERFISETIKSVLEQTYEDFELIVADNCSTDGTVKVAAQFADARLKIKTAKEHLAMFSNFNRAAGYATGTYLKFLCADDLIREDCIERQVHALDRYPTVALVSSQRKVLSEPPDDTILGSGDWAGLISRSEAIEVISRRGNIIGEPSAVLLRRNFFERMGGYNPNLNQLGDLECWCNLLKHGELFYYEEPLCTYRSHAQQATRANLSRYWMLIRENLILIKRINECAKLENWRVVKRVRAAGLFIRKAGYNLIGLPI